MNYLRVLTVLAMAVMAGAGYLAIAGPPEPFDPARVTWSALEFKASKFGFSTTSRISLGTVPGKRAAEDLIAAGKCAGLPPRGPEVLRLRILSSLFGRDSTSDLWFDPLQALAYQTVEITTGNRHRYRAYRFGDKGVYSLLRKPEQGQEALTPDLWSDTEGHTFPHPPWAGENLVVTSPSALFYILAVADLSRVGDHVEIPVFSRTAIDLLIIRVEEADRLKVNYVEATGSEESQIKGRVDTLHLSLSARPLDASTSTQFQLLGLQGDVVIHLDPRTRVPLEISGRVPRAGKVRIRLKRLALKQ
jgi:hypothetical protein